MNDLKPLNLPAKLCRVSRSGKYILLTAIRTDDGKPSYNRCVLSPEQARALIDKLNECIALVERSKSE